VTAFPSLTSVFLPEPLCHKGFKEKSILTAYSNVDKTCALGLLCTGFVIFMAKYTNSTLFDQQIRDAAEQRHHPGQYNKPNQCEEDAVRRFLST